MPPRYRLLDPASSGRGASAEKRWDYARFYFGVNVLTRQRPRGFDPIVGSARADPWGRAERLFPEWVPDVRNGVSPARRGTFRASRWLTMTGAVAVPRRETDGAGRRRARGSIRSWSS